MTHKHQRVFAETLLRGEHMAKGQYTVEHKGSDGAVIESIESVDQDQAMAWADDNIHELEGDSGATIVMTWAD